MVFPSEIVSTPSLKNFHCSPRGCESQGPKNEQHDGEGRDYWRLHVLRGRCAQGRDGVAGRNGFPEELGGSGASGGRGADAGIVSAGSQSGWRCRWRNGLCSSALRCTPWSCPSLPSPPSERRASGQEDSSRASYKSAPCSVCGAHGGGEGPVTAWRKCGGARQ